jgi:MFS family permease
MQAGAPGDEANTSIWGIRPFFQYWTGGFISSTGNWLQNVTASVVMYELTSSSLMVGVLQFANFAPVFALSIVGGVLSDRFDRTRLVMATHVFSFIVAAGLAWATLSDRVSPGVLIVSVALLGSSNALSKPTLVALLPSLVPRVVLARASSLNVLQFNLGQVIGSTLAAVLISTVGAGVAFVINAFTFFGPIVAMLLIAKHVVQGERSQGKGFAAAFEGVRYIRSHPRMVAILGAIVLANSAMEAMRTLAPGLADSWEGTGPEAAGLLIGATSAGATTAVLTFGLLARRVAPRRLLLLGFGLQAIGALGVAMAPGLTTAMVVAFPIGFGFALLIPLLTAGLQELSTDAFRGRVMSAFSMAHLGVRPGWALLAGGIATLISTSVAVVAMTVGAIVGMRVIRRVGANREVGGTVVTETVTGPPPGEGAPRDE